MDLNHNLGREEARRRIAGNIGSLPEHLPGNVADVAHRWEGDTLKLTLGAMGQEVLGDIDVREDSVHVTVTLPPMLALFAGAIQAALNRKGSDLLLEDRSDD
ncbi:polyhydroxyalkanoic acid system family protein [Sphingomicrobium lutaoense]|uniref:polyhydroxyalkanoic acid system family protein n=1 Tax=Sphingomicrobium lutaoense TaxID=515949 RepID=UPI00224067BD|nr:polyhydroxyalkanoic acid system family protein [Sphingomicrobium lutaoense]